MNEENSSNNTNGTLKDLLNEYNVGTVKPDLFVPQEVKVNAPTLTSSSVLVKFSRNIPDFVRKDKKGAKRNDDATGAKEGTHRSRKKIINCPEHDAMVQCGADYYQFHMNMCGAWEYAQQILPTCRYNNYRSEEIRVVGRTDSHGVRHPGVFYTEKKPAFIAAYPAAVAQAQLDMGSSFDPSLYPSVAELERDIQMSVVYKPIPATGDFRVDIPAQAMEEIKATYTRAMEGSVQNMANSMWKRLLKPLKNMSEKLDYGKEGKPTKFQRSLVTNVLEIVDLMRDCNFNADPDMDRVQRQLRNALMGVNTDMLKVSEVQRVKTKEEVDAIIKSLPTFGI